MEVGVAVAVYEMQCQTCRHIWVANVDCEFIKWPNGSVEIAHAQELPCPECLMMNEIETSAPNDFN